MNIEAKASDLLRDWANDEIPDSQLEERIAQALREAYQEGIGKGTSDRNE